MGKKRVAQKSGNAGVDDKIREQAARAGSGKKKKVEEGFIYINATYNNIMITATDMYGNVIAWASSGALGFSGPKKSTPFAASKAVAAVIEKVRRFGFSTAHVVARGIGSGRDSAIRTLAAQGINVVSLKDVTPIPHNGPKPKKTRRV
jgi:small subunit ribosomal protein S11